MRAALHRRQQNPGLPQGRPVPPENLHLTLLFLGQVGAAHLEPVLEMAAALPAAAFDLVLDRFGQFKRKSDRMLWVGPSRPPPNLLELRESLLQACASLGLRTPNETFRPHVTLLRKADPEPRLPAHPEPGIAWPVRHFELVESHPLPHGVRYETLARTALAP